MYCSCFHNGRLCQQECKCENCHNVHENDKERFRAVEWIREKAQRNKKID